MWLPHFDGFAVLRNTLTICETWIWSAWFSYQNLSKSVHWILNWNMHTYGQRATTTSICVIACWLCRQVAMVHTDTFLNNRTKADHPLFSKTNTSCSNSLSHTKEPLVIGTGQTKYSLMPCNSVCPVHMSCKYLKQRSKFCVQHRCILF